MRVGSSFLQKHPKECCLFLLKRIYSISYSSVILISLFMQKKILDLLGYASGSQFEEHTYNGLTISLIWVEGSRHGSFVKLQCSGSVHPMRVVS